MVTSIGRAQKWELREIGSSPILAKAVLTCLSQNKVLGTLLSTREHGHKYLATTGGDVHHGENSDLLLGVYLFFLGVLLPPVSTHCLKT